MDLASPPTDESAQPDSFESSELSVAVSSVDVPSSAASSSAASSEGEQEAKQSSGRLQWFWELARVFPAAVLLFLGMRTFIVEAYKIPSGSMEQTLLVGDFLLVNKLIYGARIPFSDARTPAIRSPERGDVVVFEYPNDPGKNFVKRLVGLPGDTLSMSDGRLTLNGKVLSEEYAVHSEPGIDPFNEAFRWQRGHLVNTAVAASPSERYRPSRDNWGPIVVPQKQYFVLGDNRDNSLDSRYWGFVPDSLMLGTPLFVYYSYMPESPSRAPWLTGIRWGRLGHVVK